MIYFCRANCVSSKNKEKTVYIVFDENQEPTLTEEILRDNQQFKEFMSDYKPKIVYVDYQVYSTEENIDRLTYPDVYESVISTAATFYSQGEMTIERQNKATKQKKKATGNMIFIGCICALIAGFGGLAGGYKLFNALGGSSPIEVIEEKANNSGLIMPEQIPIQENAEQLTVSIDRSYLAVPTEDLELKGAIIDGKATIKLPEFDKTDFFNHVPGYSWGFTSDPEGKKIEYYGGESYEFTENTKLYRVLVKYGGGSGTKNDPYRIDYYDQLELMASEDVRGYFKQTKDIYYPDYASHISIDTVNELKNDPASEYFEYDGNGYIIDGIDQPLFGKVSGATIRNVNIRNVIIENEVYKDYGAIVCNAINYQYKANQTTYKTGETLIKNCSVEHISIIIGSDVQETTESPTTGEVIPPDLIEYDADGKVIEKDKKIETVKETKVASGYSIGGISGNGGQIEDCYVADMGIYVNLNDYILNVGGISGKPDNVINCGVYNYSANGHIFHSGGIAGSAAGSKYYDANGKELPECYGGNIQGCVARYVQLNSELSAGGIAGTGSSNADDPIISNCYTKEITYNCGVYDSDNHLIESGIIGGIIGTDSTLKNGHIISNTVSMADIPVIGKKSKTIFDETVRLAPDYAFYQENILSVINSSTINPKNPKEIFIGSFKFGGSALFGDDTGSLAYPEEIESILSMEVNLNENE